MGRDLQTFGRSRLFNQSFPPLPLSAQSDPLLVMRVTGAELLKEKSRTVKFLLNDSGIVFFPTSQQHRDIKMDGLSYEDDYRGNALAGLVTPERVEIRFHAAFSDERVSRLWSRILAVPEIASAGLSAVYYQGRKLL
jgi:hypothetical protein